LAACRANLDALPATRIECLHTTTNTPARAARGPINPKNLKIQKPDFKDRGSSEHTSCSWCIHPIPWQSC